MFQAWNLNVLKLLFLKKDEVKICF